MLPRYRAIPCLMISSGVRPPKATPTIFLYELYDTISAIGRGRYWAATRLIYSLVLPNELIAPSPPGVAMCPASDAESKMAHSTDDPLAVKPRGRWFRISTLLAVLVVVTLVLTSWAFLIAPAHHAVNESLCHSNLFKLYHALVEYDAVNSSLPPAYIKGPDGNPAHSWRVLILPHLDSWGIDGDAIQQAYDFSEPWNGPSNRSLPKPVPESRFACPCGAEQQTTLTSYVVLVGPDTLFRGPESVALSDIPESVDPILVIEVTGSDIQWTEPRDLLIDTLSRSAETNSIQLSRPHAGSFRFITARGKLGVLGAGTSIDDIKRLARSGIP
jgi:hypothetical protein